MKKMTIEELKTVLESHRKYLIREKGGERANLYGANLYGANLGGADLGGADLRSANLGGANLGSLTRLGRMLRLIGACDDSIVWLDKQDHADPAKLFESARGEWKSWLAEALGGVPTFERLQIVCQFIIHDADALEAVLSGEVKS